MSSASWKTVSPLDSMTSYTVWQLEGAGAWASLRPVLA